MKIEARHVWYCVYAIYFGIIAYVGTATYYALLNLTTPQ